MSATTIAVDLAKNVSEIAISCKPGSIQERQRLNRAQFEEFSTLRVPCVVVMEACSSAHFWARLLIRRGFDVFLLPPHYVKPHGRVYDALLDPLRGGVHIQIVGRPVG